MKTPQEKKDLSYAKDRRNTYGENSKYSRKNIPLSKAQANRSERHAQDQALSQVVALTHEDDLTLAEMKAKTTAPRKWQKTPDQPLGDVLAWKAAQKVAVSGNKV